MKRVVTKEALELLHTYRGLPLTADDVAEELNVHRDSARHALKRLTNTGHVRSWRDPNTHPRPNAACLYAAVTDHA
jgi:predicted ArsR family transcriptional regulator